jgi:hypothetical protein
MHKDYSVSLHFLASHGRIRVPRLRYSKQDIHELDRVPSIGRTVKLITERELIQQ